MATDIKATSGSGIAQPEVPRSRPSVWLARTKGNVRQAAVLFACSDHVWLTYYGGRAYLAECRLAGIQPDDFGWTAEDVAAEQSFLFVDWQWTDPDVQRYLDQFLALVPEETRLRVRRGA